MPGRIRAGRALRGAVGAAVALLGISCAGGPSAEAPGPDGGYPLAAAPDADGRRWVDRTLAELTLEEEVAQLVFPWVSGAYASTTSPDFLELLSDVQAGVGGLLVSIGLPHSYAAKLNELQRRATVPLLVASDFENGGPGMRIAHVYALPSMLPQGGGTSFPPTMAFGAIGEEAFARELGRITAVEARAVGVHLNFAPVLDVNSNPRNPVINVRSFGEDPGDVGRLGSAYIRGARRGGVLTTAKHFPGHGDTDLDSHIALPVVPADRERLDTLELRPFRRAIEAGVDAVMTAHVAMPGILGDDGPPATLSPYVLTELLRDEMGFGGLVVTDALRMGAITGGYGGGEAAVRALEAGTDVLLDPMDVRETVAAVVEAVESGRLSRDRIRRSARRILEFKARAGLHRRREVDLESVDRIVGSAEHLAFADSAATRAMTLVRDRDGLVPLRADSVERVLSVTWTRPDDLLGTGEADAMLAERFASTRSVRLDARRGPAALDALWNDAWEADRVLVHPLVGYRAGTGSVAVPEEFARFVRRLAIHRPTIVTSFGNPYLLSSFPEVGTYLLAWGGREVTQRAAVRALAGEAAITGTLPISLPPYHERGEGLRRERDPAAPRVAEQGGDGDGAAADGDAQLAGTASDLDSIPMAVSSAESRAAGAGMSADALARLDTVLLRAVADSVTPGAALAVVRGDRLVRLRGYGRTDYRSGAPPATPTTLYDVASLTKVVATTTAVMRLIDEGRLALDDRVVEHLPWWAGDDPRKERVTVRQLLLHRAGLPAHEPLYREIEGRAAFERALANLELMAEPGARYAYSDLGAITLGFVVEAAAGTALDRYLDGAVWRPLGMEDTGFLPDPALRSRIAPTEVDTLYRLAHVHGTVHDENAHALGGVAGHAGLFSTAADLAVFAAAMGAGGVLEPCRGAGPSVACTVPWAEGGRIASEERVRAFTGRYDDRSSRALGWDTPSGRSSAGDYFTARSFGHTGFTGTSIWIDPELDLRVVLLTNRVNPTRDEDRHVELRRRVHDLAARAITDRPAERRR